MARFKNDPFPGTDYSQYLKWEKVVLPSGEVLYVVPNHKGYVFDPVASNATGRKIFRANPQQQITAQQQQEQEIQQQKDNQAKLVKQQQFNMSPAGQLIPVAAGTAGIIAATRLGAPTIAPTAVKLLENGSILMSDGTIKAAAGQALTPTITNAVTPSLVNPSLASAAAEGAGAVAPIASSAIGTGGVDAAGAMLPGFATEATAPAAAEAAAPGLLGGYGIGAGPLALIAAGTILGGKSAYDMFRGKNDKSIPGLIGRGTLGIATGGLSEIARPFLMHKSTRDVAREHTEDLLKQGKDDAGYQAYVTGMRKQYDAAPPDPSKPFAGKYATFEDYKKAGLQADDLTGVYGNIKVYGPEWAKLTQEQRRAITQANIESGLYSSKKGEVEITDANKAIENKNNVLKGFEVGAQTQAKAAAAGAVAPPATPVIATNVSNVKPGAVVARSNTRSPGIGLDGRPIYY